ncbi:MAG: choice-of-anchor M domain-containing protein [Corynebacterium sp.]|nr:choice-of-anchor M domain-containing protein [Corynebacterium sp.]
MNSHRHHHLLRHSLTGVATAGLITAGLHAASLSAVPAAIAAQSSHVEVLAQGDGLAQVVTADETIAPAGTRTVIPRGHVDLGAQFINGELVLLARDDTQATPVWREVDDVVLALDNTALQTLPENSDYDFTGAKPGAQVWVVPQVEVAGVPWLGWNTQAPSLVENSGGLGVTMRIEGHDGPGDASLFLQQGGFGAPEVLWSTTGAGPGEFFVEHNTHTHANWVFTQPGIHHIRLSVDVTLPDDSVQTVTRDIALTTGEETDPNAAFATSYDEASAHSTVSNAAEGNNMLLWGGIAAGLGVLVLAAAVMATRSRSKTSTRDTTGATADNAASDNLAPTENPRS